MTRKHETLYYNFKIWKDPEKTSVISLNSHLFNMHLKT